MTRLRSDLLGGKSSARETGDTFLNGELPFLALYHFTALVLRISNNGKIQNTILTLDKVLNVSMYGLLHFDEIQYDGEHVKWP